MGKLMVDAPLTVFVRAAVRPTGLGRGMDSLFISDRTALSDAAELLDRFGNKAGFEAAARADISRDAGNVMRFCHWRQIERVIATLSSEEVRGTVH